MQFLAGETQVQATGVVGWLADHTGLYPPAPFPPAGMHLKAT